MGRRGDGYGSEDHLRRYLDGCEQVFNDAVARVVRVPPSSIRWRPSPRRLDGTEREFRGLEFLKETDKEAFDGWRGSWPSTGTPISWDAVGNADGEWLLVEAKSNRPEFCSPPSGAKGDSFKLITKTLNETKKHLGVHRFFTWTGSYYQYANRLAVLRFLRRHDIPAHLVFVYFVGDVFPDGTPCPATKAEWEKLIEARRLTLGLPKRHPLSAFVHSVFLPPCKPGGSGVTAGPMKPFRSTEATAPLPPER